MYSLRRRQNRGVGSVYSGPCTSMPLLAVLSPECWSRAWANLTTSDPVIAPPPAPPQSVWRVPPASGADAQATVDAAVNQQLRDQQTLNAGQVQSSVYDIVGGELYQVGSSVGDAAFSAVSWLPWVLGAIGVFAVVAVGAGTPRRYGR